MLDTENHLPETSLQEVEAQADLANASETADLFEQSTDQGSTPDLVSTRADLFDNAGEASQTEKPATEATLDAADHNVIADKNQNPTHTRQNTLVETLSQKCLDINSQLIYKEIRYLKFAKKGVNQAYLSDWRIEIINLSRLHAEMSKRLKKAIALTAC